MKYFTSKLYIAYIKTITFLANIMRSILVFITKVLCPICSDDLETMIKSNQAKSDIQNLNISVSDKNSVMNTEQSSKPKFRCKFFRKFLDKLYHKL